MAACHSCHRDHFDNEATRKGYVGKLRTCPRCKRRVCKNCRAFDASRRMACMRCALKSFAQE